MLLQNSNPPINLSKKSLIKQAANTPHKCEICRNLSNGDNLLIYTVDFAHRREVNGIFISIKHWQVSLCRSPPLALYFHRM